MEQGLRQRSRPWHIAGPGTLAHPADVVLVLGDIGQMREVAEGAHDAHGLADRHAVEDQLEFAPRRLVVAAVKPDRGLADALNQIEDVGAFLVADGIAEDAPQQADVVSQPDIVFQRCNFLATSGLQPVFRHGLGGHRQNAPESAGTLESQFLRRSARPRNRRMVPTNAPACATGTDRAVTDRQTAGRVCRYWHARPRSGYGFRSASAVRSIPPAVPAPDRPRACSACAWWHGSH